MQTIGSRFGGLPQTLPSFAWPDIRWASAKQLLIPTLTIALLRAVESLLCVRVADKLSELPRHDPNQELMAQGLANIVTPLFGGIAATDTLARTVTNPRAGATSPVAGMVHAGVLLLIELFGSLFFGAVGRIEELSAHISPGTRAIVLEMAKMIAMDTSGLDALQHLHRTLQRQGVALVLANVNEQPLSLIQRSGFEVVLGAEHIVPSLAEGVGGA